MGMQPVQVKNTKESWGLVSQVLHWGLALLIFGMLGLGYSMHNLVMDLQLKFTLYQLHKSFGFLVALLVLLRLGWRLTQPVPRLPDSMKPGEKRLANLSHIMLYGLLILMPLSGWIHTETAALDIPTRIFDLFVLPDPFGPNKALHAFFHTVHEWAAWTLAALILLHILAALWHHFVTRDDIFRRMVPFSTRARSQPGSDV